MIIATISVLVILIALVFVFEQNDTQNTDNSLSIEEQNNVDIYDNDAEIKNEIFIKGSDTILPVSIAESEAFMKLNSQDEVIVIGGGSSLGIASFIEGEIEIAMASRKIKDSEIESAMEKGINPVETVIGWDGIAVIVNKKNTFDSLTIEQLKKIYTGEVSNWKELGGEDEEIEVLVRDTSSGTYAFFKEHVLEDEEYTSEAVTEPNTEAIVETVASDSSAIGYIGLAYADSSVKMLGLETTEGTFHPEQESILKGEYPLARPLQYYTDGEPDGEVGDYIDFVLSDLGQSIIKEIGYLPIN
ncbi:PstS family phosphate ABC transporter substrate-binding protein [Methanolobus vulcani]|uniref:PstS family phosphate ABC transporter substrate-binding protein n=2 Tax=Methanolobus vulcani TaxID=38026 RepID=A0A7Z8KPF8_9EURY|nr:PstS family phosphate ABC transporter substrate-binding protein [Methanolobus vulcani]